MPTDIATTLPQIELGPGASVTVDTGDPGAIVTGLVVYGRFFNPDGTPADELAPLFVPVPVEQ
jgi:hypothetical protein